MINFAQVIGNLTPRICTSRDTNQFLPKIYKEKEIFEDFIFKDPIEPIVERQKQEFERSNAKRKAQDRYNAEHLTESSLAGKNLT